MKYTVHYSVRFKKSLKKVRELPGFKPEKFKLAIQTLSNGDTLPASFRDHHLTGNLRLFRECHIAPDILLVYQVDDSVLVLTLVTIGTHAQLFKM